MEVMTTTTKKLLLLLNRKRLKPIKKQVAAKRLLVEKLLVVLQVKQKQKPKFDKKYDYLYINAQNPLNHLNAGDIFYYTSQDSLLKWTHIGNFQSPLVTQSPSPVYGYGLSNLTTDSTKTAEIDEGTIHVDYTPEQLGFKTLTTNELLNFNVDPRNAYGDKVHIPYTIMEFLIKRVR